MSTLSFLSRAKLIRELLAPPHPAAVSDASATYTSPNDSQPLARCDALVKHKLAVAREILLRDLIAQMQSGPVLSVSANFFPPVLCR